MFSGWILLKGSGRQVNFEAAWDFKGVVGSIQDAIEENNIKSGDIFSAEVEGPEGRFALSGRAVRGMLQRSE